MKRIKSTVAYKVPNWNFCNVDRFDLDGTPSKQLCQFCQKTKAGYRCTLYDEMLSAAGNEVAKTRQCCKATAGYPSVIEPAQPATTPTVPTIPPKDLMKQTIELYSKTVNDLITQGYPRPMAEMAAKKFILESN